MSRDPAAPSPERGALTSHNLAAGATLSLVDPSLQRAISDEDLTLLLAESDPEKVLQLIEALPDTLAETFLEELGVPEAEWQAPASPALMGQYLDSSFVIRPHIAHLSEVLTRALRDVEAGHSRRLVIEMPPRSGKTYLATIIVAAWILAKHPDWPIMLTSHDGSLAVSWGRVIRRWAASGKLGPNAMLVGDSSAASEWETKAGGVVLSRSVRESLTGRGAKVLLVDDPHKDFVEAHSETVRNMVWNWWLSVAQTRLEPPSLTIITMTRWHEDDLVGRILSDQYPGDPSDVEVVRLPALAEENDALGRAVGEPLLSPLLKETPAQALVRWSEVEKSVGPYTWSAMFQQSPMPPEGMIFNPDTWRYWTTDPEQVTSDGKIVLLPSYASLALGTWLDSWDLTFTASATSDYVVGQRWVKVDSTRYLIAQKRGKWDFSAQIDQMKEWLKTDDDALSPLGHLVHTRLIEKAANGAAMISQLQPKVAGLKPITPRGPKEMRARAIEPEFYSGHVRFPHPAMPGYEWVGDLLTELQTFPNGKNDDQVDALSQALLELRDPTDGESSVSIPDGMISRAYRGDTPFLPSATPDFSLSQIYGGSPLSSSQSRGVGRPRLDTTTRRI